MDPATVPPDGWEPYRTRDGRVRKAILELQENTVFPRHRTLELAGTYTHSAALS